jgi:regulator of replication initiation timing
MKILSSELAGKSEEVKRLTKQLQELILERQEIDAKFEEWHTTFSQEVAAKDEMNR